MVCLRLRRGGGAPRIFVLVHGKAPKKLIHVHVYPLQRQRDGCLWPVRFFDGVMIGCVRGAEGIERGRNGGVGHDSLDPPV